MTISSAQVGPTLPKPKTQQAPRRIPPTLLEPRESNLPEITPDGKGGWLVHARRMRQGQAYVLQMGEDAFVVRNEPDGLTLYRFPE